MAGGPEGERWPERPVLGALLQALIALIPLALGVAAGLAVIRTVASGWLAGPWLTWLVAGVTATLVIGLTQPLVRRLLPLAWLLRLGMLWPGRAPSRFALARRAGRLGDVEEQLARARDRGLEGDPSAAASQVLTMVTALTAHDRRTRGHAERVRIFTDLLAVELGLGRPDRDRLRWAALLHDIGKLEVPEQVLNKPGRPSPTEWEQLRAHPAAGHRILAPLRAWLGPWADATLHHHERWDGQGYPQGLAGTDISEGGRIVAVADAYEVMTAARTYKRPMSAAKAREELVACAGGQFDPVVVRAFLLIPITRLRWALGPFSWVAQLPLAREVVHASGALTGAKVSTAAGATASAAVIGLGQFSGQAAARADVYPVPDVPPPTTTTAQERESAEPDGRVIGATDDVLDPQQRALSSDDPNRDDHGDHAQPDPPPTGDHQPHEPTPGDDGSGADDPEAGGTDPVEDTVEEIAGTVEDVVDDTLDTVNEVGEALAGAVEDTTAALGGTVQDLGETTDDATDDTTATVRGLLGR